MMRLVCLALSVLVSGSPLPAQNDAPSAHPELRELRKIRLREVLVFEAGGGVAHDVAFHPGGALLASAGERGDIILWDLAKRAIVWHVEADEHWIGTLRFSPDGERLAAIGRNLTVWRVVDGKKLHGVVCGGPEGLAWSRDGARLAYHSGNGVVNVLDANSYEILRSFNQIKRYPIGCLDFTADGTALYGGDSVGNVWRFQAAAPRAKIVRAHPKVDHSSSSVQGIAVLDTGDLVSVGWKGAIVIGDRSVEHGDTPYKLAVNSARDRFAVGGSKGDVRIYDASGKQRSEVPARDSAISGIGFSPDGKRLAIATYDGRLRIWSGKEVAFELPGHPSQVESLCFSPDSRWVAATGRGTSFLRLSDKHTRTLRGGLNVATGRTGSGVFVLSKGELVLWSLDDNKRVARFEVASVRQRARCLSVSPDGKLAVLGGGLSAHPTIVDLSDGSTTRIRSFERFLDLAWLPGNSFVVGTVGGNHGEFGSVRVMLPDHSVKFTKKYRCGVASVTFSPSGRYLIYAKGGGSLYQHVPYEIHRVDAKTFDPKGTTKAEAHWLRYVDRHLAISHDYAQLTLWHGDTLTRLYDRPVPGLRAAALSPDHKLVAVADSMHVRVFRFAR